MELSPEQVADIARRLQYCEQAIEVLLDAVAKQQAIIYLLAANKVTLGTVQPAPTKDRKVPT